MKSKFKKTSEPFKPSFSDSFSHQIDPINSFLINSQMGFSNDIVARSMHLQPGRERSSTNKTFSFNGQGNYSSKEVDMYFRNSSQSFHDQSRESSILGINHNLKTWDNLTRPRSKKHIESYHLNYFPKDLNQNQEKDEKNDSNEDNYELDPLINKHIYKILDDSSEEDIFEDNGRNRGDTKQFKPKSNLTSFNEKKTIKRKVRTKDVNDHGNNGFSQEDKNDTLDNFEKSRGKLDSQSNESFINITSNINNKTIASFENGITSKAQITKNQTFHNSLNHLKNAEEIRNLDLEEYLDQVILKRK